MEATEFEPLNPLQIFLLILVNYGLASPYDLLSKAGLGPGLTSPALKRLKEAELLTSTSGPRNRLRYALTEKGANLLRESVRPDDASYWAVGQTDIFESLPRGIILAWLFFGVDEAHRGAVRAAEQLLIMAGRRQREAEELHASLLRLQPEILKDGPTPAKGVMIATAYQWIKAEYDATLFRLEGEAIERLHQLLAELPPVPLFGERDGVL
jgi:DNA-binding MarR family transcriptional regulator